MMSDDDHKDEKELDSNVVEEMGEHEDSEDNDMSEIGGEEE